MHAAASTTTTTTATATATTTAAITTTPTTTTTTTTTTITTTTRLLLDLIDPCFIFIKINQTIDEHCLWRFTCEFRRAHQALSGQHSEPECQKTPIKDRLEEAIIQEIVRTHDDIQKVCFSKFVMFSRSMETFRV